MCYTTFPLSTNECKNESGEWHSKDKIQAAQHHKPAFARWFPSPTVIVPCQAGR
ncbi:predicted protein [Chaetomium globosum CBS 148.51]|uniref:Uncharacterized protein n=1 Tax=Chaetomium globosum (strain ATCC 6205 / CBS 148.51 / DSM 1962 / NBRC 6347 / NRRL 1970) TaxID=306901 RepID=Q2GQB4_CHAGB|nr:uncharacterized protein CHGG_09840 [Chaetomium globosum CBS 148.51]EAQ83436.1 predicted protein [Chaetomium globosum CBS 148.51]